MYTHYTNYDEPYRDLFYFFSSNSCNFVDSPNRPKHDCPKGFVFCEKNGSKPVLIQKKMTFQTASNYCSNISSHICKPVILIPFVGANFKVVLQTHQKILKKYQKLSSAIIKVIRSIKYGLIWKGWTWHTSGKVGLNIETIQNANISNYWIGVSRDDDLVHQRKFVFKLKRAVVALSGKACGWEQVTARLTGLDSRDSRAWIRFYIHFQSLYRQFLLRIKIRIRSSWNPDKKRELDGYKIESTKQLYKPAAVP